MSQFSDITYTPPSAGSGSNLTNEEAPHGTVLVGAGAIWDDVYAYLDPLGVGVVGGRVMGIGVAGFSLGGGYGWTTNQHGLAVDNILSYELVKPNGAVVNVTRALDPELFFGLKGGLNNFVRTYCSLLS